MKVLLVFLAAAAHAAPAPHIFVPHFVSVGVVETSSHYVVPTVFSRSDIEPSTHYVESLIVRPETYADFPEYLPEIFFEDKRHPLPEPVGEFEELHYYIPVTRTVDDSPIAPVAGTFRAVEKKAQDVMPKRITKKKDVNLVASVIERTAAERTGVYFSPSV